MRARSLAVFSTAALAAILLVGCTAGDTKVATAEVAPVTDMCAVAAPAGAVSDAIVVEGAVGSPASVTLAAPLIITSTERTVVVEGSGDKVDGGSLIDYAMTVYDATTGAQRQAQGYDDAATLSVPASTVGQFVGCATVGSRVAVAVPATDQDGPTVWVLDVLGVTPAVATGESQKPVEGMPTVELAGGGAPTVTIPGDQPPAETAVDVLKKGDGAVVGVGDSVMLQYTGVRWSDGTVFDSSWAKGSPTALVTTEVIAGYKQALEGQTVGSQVLVVIPPEFAYGEGEINEDDLTGETLVFVIDILETVPAG